VAQFLCAAVLMVGFMLGGQTATPQHSAIDGKWHFILDTPGGDREMDAEFTADAGLFAADGRHRVDAG
jgi:hypothetical protein